MGSTRRHSPPCGYDVDFCLRSTEAGRRPVWHPGIVLRHCGGPVTRDRGRERRRRRRMRLRCVPGGECGWPRIRPTIRTSPARRTCSTSRFPTLPPEPSRDETTPGARYVRCTPGRPRERGEAKTRRGRPRAWVPAEAWRSDWHPGPSRPGRVSPSGRHFGTRMKHPPTLALLAAPQGAGQSLGAALRDWRRGFMRRRSREAQWSN